jgi:hypothetical protein
VVFVQLQVRGQSLAEIRASLLHGGIDRAALPLSGLIVLSELGERHRHGFI